MKKFISVFVLLFTTIIILSACSSGNTESSGYKTESLDNLQQLLDEGNKLVDVREVSEFEAGHIDGAMNVPLSTIQAGDYATLTKDDKYVIICRSGNRSAQASDILSKEGFTVINLDQGMSSWTGEVVQ